MSTLTTIDSRTFRHTRTAVRVSGLQLLALSFQTLGIIYSDIGTSPLYVLNGIWPASGGMPSEEDIIGGISAIIWALTLLPLLKYIIISLCFGTKEGEGGTFALYLGIYPPREVDFDDERTLTGFSHDDTFLSSASRTIKEKMRWPLLLWSLFATALTMSDGVLTPAVSVTSAVSGIAIAKPSVLKDIVGISIIFLLALFFVQQFGTSRLAFLFAPISSIWFLLLMGTGIYNITFYPAIFRAFDPSRAVLLFVRTKDYDLLAGVLLAITGCEAVFANLGQFNAPSIRLSFCGFVYPTLVLAYLGQGARLIVDKEKILPHIFYNSIPGPTGGALYWIMFVFAVLATLVASQALITAAFSLVQQLINSRCFPPLRMHFTSETIQGQVYIPAVNWTLMIATIVLVAAFSDLDRLTDAYGFAVATVMIATSLMLALQMKYVKKWSVAVGLVFLLIFGFIDGLFWGASVKKVPHGAWVPLMMGCILTAIMVHWTWARGLEDTFEGKKRMNLRYFIGQSSRTPSINFSDGEDSIDVDPQPYCFMKLGGPDSEKHRIDSQSLQVETELQRIPTCAVFHKTTSGRGVPHSFVGFIRQWPALPRVVIFLSVCLAPCPRVPPQERYAVTKVRTVDGFYGVTYYVGFRDKFDVQIDNLIEKICEVEILTNPGLSRSVLDEIRSVSKTTTHLVPHHFVVSKRVDVGLLSPIVNYVRRVLIESLYRRMATMFPETANWLNAADEIIHVGVHAVI
ncbi:potassium transporter [Crepidotus variabilis]|uniref:Potassium transporter n=1 Tax=Crepidotus variabilis TaxID=179855 RepID=A0A9P6E9R2_9AGAR|nr:potassium transporter [Crepidotus variabilis]